MDNMKFRVRFRFRLRNKLNIEASQHPMVIGTYNVVLTPHSERPEAINICDSEWLVMNAGPFDSEEEAWTFARKLKIACEVSSVGARLGIDSGVDLPTSGFTEAVKDHFREQGRLLRDSVHGIDVFPDIPTIEFRFSATGEVLAAPDPFLADVDRLFKVVENASQRTNDIVLLLNDALMQAEPVAQIVLAIAAVEMLGQDQDWSPVQRQLLERLETSARNEATGTQQEREEVAKAIGKMHKLSLRQGVLRLLSTLELDHLKPVWDDLYNKRSRLVHGKDPQPGADYHELARKTVDLCGQILLKAVATEVGEADCHVAKFYPQ